VLPSSVLPSSVELRDVGPRDGLQVEAPVDVRHRVALVESLIAAGLRHIEICSFVSPAAVPAMAGAAELVAALGPSPEGACFTALVPNLRGAAMALEAGVDELTVTVSASEAYSEKNVRMSIAASLAAVADVCRAAADHGVAVDAVLSCAFGSPYGDVVDTTAVATLADRLRAAGATRLTLADTTGMATPRSVGKVIELIGPDVGLHLHETRGTGLVNAFAALQLGVTRFDTSVGGLGGSPFALGAAGNLATESLVYLLDDLGVVTGVDIEALLDTCRLVEELVGHPLSSRVAAAGTREHPRNG
jgi:hydroxymethylglutaryl-CoA lyase